MKSVLIIFILVINLIAGDNTNLLQRLKSGDGIVESKKSRQQCVIPKEFTKLEHPMNKGAKNILKQQKGLEKMFSKNLKAFLPLPEGVKVKPNILKKKINLVYKFD